MPARTCNGCGRITQGRYCPTCNPSPTNSTSWNGTRDRTAQARFRRHVLERDGHQCTYTVNGQRCTQTQNLQAHHLHPGYDPEAGVTLCVTHHRHVDQHAR